MNTSANQQLESPERLQIKKEGLQTSGAWLVYIAYFSTMTRKQLFITYAITVAMMVWGIDLLNAVKLHLPVRLSDMLHLFAITQVIYTSVTMVLTVAVFKKFFVAKRFLLLFGSVVALTIFFILFRFLLEEVICPRLFDASNYSENVSLIYYGLDNIYYALIYILLGFLIFMLDNQFRIQKKQAELVQQSRDAELQFLRSQINPHFLFNTLNNIYSLVYEKSDKAPAATLQLSELMRYTLYEKKEFVPVSKEWKYIQSFIQLQQLRFEKEIQLDIDSFGLERNSDAVIAPYLLIPFIENAFKHADLADNSSPLYIRLEVKEKEIVFEVSNKIGKQQKDKAGGVGLENVKRRLQLVYPGKHSLQIAIKEEIYSTRLSIDRA